MAGRHHRVGLDHYVPEWGLELYRNQRALEARMDEIVADAHEVRSNVQAFIAEVQAKMAEHVDAPEDRSAEVADLQAQLDAIDADIREAREQMAVIAGEPQTDDSGVPIPAPVEDSVPVEDNAVVTEDAQVDVVEAPAVVTDPNAPSRAPGFE